MLERGEVANSWRRERWDSLRLLTPNSQSRLPGYRYEGADPDGFMTMPEVVEFIARLRARLSPRRYARTPKSRRCGPRTTTATASSRRSGELHCRSLVIASGACNVAVRAGAARSRACVDRVLSRRSTTAIRAACPKAACSSSARPPPACSSPTRSGAPAGACAIAVGEHVRLPRTYRGRDVLWWMEASRHLEPALRRDRRRRARAQAAVAAARRLAGAHDARSERVERGGRRDRRAARGDARRARAVLGRVAQSVRARGSEDESPARVVRRVGARARRISTPVRRSASSRRARRPRRGCSLDLASGEIRSIVWATGFRPDYRWLDVPVLDRKGPAAARRRRRRRAAACTRSGCRCCAGASRRSSTAPRTTRAISSSSSHGRCRPADEEMFMVELERALPEKPAEKSHVH